ncbi:MAG: TlpA disulfide reductase family protein [Pseudomonadota bacterium]
MIRHSLKALLAACLLALAVPSLANPILVGEPPPDELGNSTEGQRILLSEGKGQLQIVSFWATWCPPCREELPILNAIQTQVGADRLRVIAINLEEPRRQFRRAMRAYKDFELTFVHDKRGTIARRYGVKGIPFMVILDVDGTVAYTHTGYNESELPGIVDEINGLLIKNKLYVDAAPDDAVGGPAQNGD